MEVSTTGVNLTGSPTVNSVAIANTTQVAAKQDTLVSGTNIKTINGTSVLGSGNIVTPTTSPSGVSGAIQFSNGSAFASDATNFFWDDTNNRLGVGTNAPTATTHIVGANNLANSYALKVLNLANQGILSVTNDGFTQIGDFTGAGYGANLSFLRSSGGTRATTFNQGNQNLSITNVNGGVIFQNTPITVVGSGSTSATTSLLVQNSAGAASLQVTDDGVIQGNAGTQLRYRFGGSSPMGVSTRNGAFTIGVIDGGFTLGMQFNVNSSSGKGYIDGWATFDLVIGNNGNPVQIGTDSSVASAQLTVNSTTKGFMPPRMTTTQRDNIVGVAAGLIIYNSVTNKLQCYNGSTWNDLF
jgi:hypothetical protein